MRKITQQDLILFNKTSSKGNQGKYHIQNEWIKTDYLGYEAAAEYLCSEILQFSNISDYVSYKIESIQIENRNGLFRKETACVSDNFLLEGYEIITLDKFIKAQTGLPFEKIIQGKSIKEAISYVVNLVESNTDISHFGEYLTSMFEFDAFVLNEDRHTQNIILLKNGDHYIPGPIFDNGSAFLSDITQEYPLTEKTKYLTSVVKAKPFSTSFQLQVEACQELYGKQLTIQNIDITYPVNKIRNVYGNKIAERMQYIYDLQLHKCRNFLQIEKITSDALYDENSMKDELIQYVQGGGHIATKLVPNDFIKEIKESLMEEEIPFVCIDNQNNGLYICTKDMNTKDFLQIQKKVFSSKEKMECFEINDSKKINSIFYPELE